MKSSVVVARTFSAGDQRLVGLRDFAGRRCARRRGDARSCCVAGCPNTWCPICSCVLPALPLTPNGKIDRKALPPPQARTCGRSKAATCLMTPASAVSPRIWREVLQVDQVGLNENFFDLGGHSLLLVRLHADLKQAFAHGLSAGRIVPAHDGCGAGGAAVVHAPSWTMP